jgi:hypothetical protein
VSGGCAYRGTKNSYLCEHVPFHLCLRSLGMRIALLPRVEVKCGRPILYAPPKRTVRVLANGTVIASASRTRATRQNVCEGAGMRPLAGLCCASALSVRP